AEPVAHRVGLPLAQRRQRHVHVAAVDVDQMQAGRLGLLAREVARALAVAHDPDRLRPFLLEGRGAHPWQAASRVPAGRVSTRPRPALDLPSTRQYGRTGSPPTI